MKTLPTIQPTKMNSSVIIEAGPALIGGLKAMACQSGCHLLEELGSKASFKRLSEARQVEVPKALTIRVDLGRRIQHTYCPMSGLRAFTGESNESIQARLIGEHDSIATQALFELGFRVRVARRNAANKSWIKSITIEQT